MCEYECVRTFVSVFQVCKHLPDTRDFIRARALMLEKCFYVLKTWKTVPKLRFGLVGTDLVGSTKLNENVKLCEISTLHSEVLPFAFVSTSTVANFHFSRPVLSLTGVKCRNRGLLCSVLVHTRAHAFDAHECNCAHSIVLHAHARSHWRASTRACVCAISISEKVSFSK